MGGGTIYIYILRETCVYRGFHPVAQKAFAEGFRREHVVPVSVYFDGVQYTKNEHFLGFYMTNLRTGKQQLVWLLSAFAER